LSGQCGQNGLIELEAALEAKRLTAPQITPKQQSNPTPIKSLIAVAHCNLGWTYEAIGDERQAIAHYRKALEFDPSLVAARDNLKLLDATPDH
jgi:tetratricopeptide (TPR) repeat protein